MSRRRWILTGVLLLALLAGAGWQGRHRIRAWLSQRSELNQQTAFEIELNDDERPMAADPSLITDLDWPSWRGYLGNNHASDPLPPMIWNETENVLWKTAVPGRGHSSGCIVGQRIFLTTAIEDQKSQQVICLDFDSGKILWMTQAHQGKFIYRNLKNSEASSTPASDGHSVFALFPINGSIWLTSLSMDGNILWQCEIGPYASKEGFGASPVIAGDLVIVAADCVNQSWMAAVHRKSGTIVWRKSRGPGTSYASPALIEYQGKNVIAMAGLDRVAAINPDNGNELWKVAGPDMSASTPVASDGMLFVTGCTPKAGISGIRLSEFPEVVWNLPIKAEVPSPLAVDGLVYFAQDAGILMCCEAASGQLVWRQRLGGNISASPVLCGENILVTIEDGRTIVLKKGPNWEKVAENRLESDGVYATPAIARGRIILRTTEFVYAIGNQQSLDQHQN